MQNTFYLIKNESLKKFFKRSNIWKSILKCSASFEIVSHPRIFCLKNHLEIIQAKISKRQTVQNINCKKASTFKLWIWCFFFYVILYRKEISCKINYIFSKFYFFWRKKNFVQCHNVRFSWTNSFLLGEQVCLFLWKIAYCQKFWQDMWILSNVLVYSRIGMVEL